MVPRILHQIWFQGVHAVPEKYRANSAKLKALNPEWRYMLWDDGSLREQCQLLGDAVLATYSGFEHMHQKIDFGRYVVVFRYGGASIDMDVDAIRPLRSLGDLDGCDLVVSTAPLSKLEVLAYSWGRFVVLLNNATILARAQSPYILRLIRDIVGTPPTSWSGKMYAIQWSTGPFIFTQSLSASFHTLGRSKVLVTAPEVFEPCYSHDPGCTPSPESILDHQHATSWVDNNLIFVSTGYYVIKPYLPLVVLVSMLLAVHRCSRKV